VKGLSVRFLAVICALLTAVIEIRTSFRSVCWISIWESEARGAGRGSDE